MSRAFTRAFWDSPVFSMANMVGAYLMLAAPGSGTLRGVEWLAGLLLLMRRRATKRITTDAVSSH